MCSNDQIEGLQGKIRNMETVVADRDALIEKSRQEADRNIRMNNVAHDDEVSKLKNEVMHVESFMNIRS